MKIRIRKDAVDLYIQQHTDWNGYYDGKDRWEQIFDEISGKEVEVDTEMLFKHEFNVKPILGVTKRTIRIMDEYVDEVIDDIRYGKARCEFCDAVSDSTECCTHCGRSDYLEPYFDQ